MTRGHGQFGRQGQDLCRGPLNMQHIKYISCGPLGFREDVLSFSHYKSMGVNDPVEWPIWIPGAWQAGYMQGTTKHCHILNI